MSSRSPSLSQAPVGNAIARDFAIAITLLTAYACLHPFSGWRSTGVGVFDFLWAPWPRYYTRADLIINVLGFMPLGFAWVATLATRSRPGRLVLAVTLAGMLFSLAVETTQNFLPTRVASNLDVGANTLGAFLGAWCGLPGAPFFARGGPLERWRLRRVIPGRSGSLGLLLVALWWFSLLNPSSYLFAGGDLHNLVDTATELSLSGKGFLRVEAALAAVNTLVLGLFAQRVMRTPSLWLAALVIALGLAVKALATWAFLSPPQPLHWATPGGLRGLAIGLVLLAACWRAAPRVRHAVLCVCLLASTGLVNLAPDNPYWDASTRLVNEGHVLNFHGATTLMASLWPFLGLLWLVVVGPGRRERGSVA
ncbi:VanZ family protein [Niveibacterium sp. SC-1]|uniref:VanZ family protein n=1 Tax=Niveibacterium sp. SC-1 TaxID=3135646 RepID=UPI00311F329A